MLEVLVLVACLEGSPESCDGSLRAYYQTPTPITQTVRKLEERTINVYKEVPVLTMLGPVIGAAVQGEATIKIGYGFSIKTDIVNNTIFYSKSF